MSVDSPNLGSLDRWAFHMRKVEKPWGYELIWALTDVYCGKVLFVKASGDVQYQYVIAAMDAARGAGVKVLGGVLQ